MLVLTRKPGQVIRIGNDILLEVVSVNGENIKIGITAPSDVQILREEVYQSVLLQNKSSITSPNLTSLKDVRLNPVREDKIESN